MSNIYLVWKSSLKTTCLGCFRCHKERYDTDTWDFLESYGLLPKQKDCCCRVNFIKHIVCLHPLPWDWLHTCFIIVNTFQKFTISKIFMHMSGRRFTENVLFHTYANERQQLFSIKMLLCFKIIRSTFWLLGHVDNVFLIIKMMLEHV